MIGRRRLVRTAATAAWAVPAIQVAAAVPAFAASGCGVTAAGTAAWRSGGLNYLDTSLTLANDCGTALTGPLTVSLTYCVFDGIGYTPADHSGWTQVGDAQVAQNGCTTLTFTTAQGLPSNGQVTVTFVAKTMSYDGSDDGTPGEKRPAGTVTATLIGGGSPIAPVALPVAKVLK